MTFSKQRKRAWKNDGSLGQKLEKSRKLVLSQELRDSVELLSLSQEALLKRIRRESIENPLLEINENDTDTLEGSIDQNSSLDSSKGEQDFESRFGDSDSKHQFLQNTIPTPESLGESLIWQLRLLDIEPKEKETGIILISDINEMGFLVHSIDELFTPREREDAKRALERIYTLEPIGCGARNSTESLLIQSRILFPEDKAVHLLLSQFYKDFQKLNFALLERSAGLSREEVFRCFHKIRGLEPYPGRLHSSTSPRYVIPDFTVREKEGKLLLTVNDEWLPEMILSEPSFVLQKEIKLGSKDDKYIKEKMNSARMFIRNIQRRRQTLILVAQEILSLQSSFFLKGPDNLHPLVLRDVAEKTGFHESTISRSVSNKYIQTRWGCFELKYFFSGEVKTTTLPSVQGIFTKKSVSVQNVQNEIQQMIQKENPTHPLSDQDISDLLAKNGRKVARRTVAKYRNILSILSVSQRRRLAKLRCIP